MKQLGSNIIVFQMMTHNKARLAISLCGIGFVTLVLFMGIGFFNGLNDSQARLATILDADLVMMNVKSRSINSFKPFHRNRMFQAVAFEEVEEVIPIYDGQTKISNPQTGMNKTIFFLAFPMDSRPFSIPGFDDHAHQLKYRGNILFDDTSRKIFGKIKTGMDVEIMDIPHQVAGMVELGPNFSKNGYILMSDVTLLTGLGAHRLDPEKISFGLLKTRPGTDIPVLKTRLKEVFSDEFKFMTPTEMARFEIRFTTRSTPIGALLGIGLIVGFGIGVIISYQILYTEVTDHMPQFATLKAVGFSKKFMTGIVFKEALLLSVMGFIPGLAASFGLYAFIEHCSRIVMTLTLERVLVIFVLTVLMCNIAGFLAVRKALMADPAELF